MRADQLNTLSLPFMLREYGQDDSAWQLAVRAWVTITPDARNPEERSPLKDWFHVVTVEMADGMERLFNHSDMVEVRPAPQ